MPITPIINTINKYILLHNYKKQKKKKVVEENIPKYLNRNLDMVEFVKVISYHYKKV